MGFLLVGLFVLSVSVPGYSQGWLKKGLEKAKEAAEEQADKLLDEQVDDKKAKVDVAQTLLDTTGLLDNGLYHNKELGYSLEIPEGWRAYLEGGKFIMINETDPDPNRLQLNTTALKHCVKNDINPVQASPDINLLSVMVTVIVDNDKTPINNINLYAIKAAIEGSSNNFNTKKVKGINYMPFAGHPSIGIEMNVVTLVKNADNTETITSANSLAFITKCNGLQYTVTYTAPEPYYPHFFPMFKEHLNKVVISDLTKPSSGLDQIGG